jgi:hypothetical protein
VARGATLEGVLFLVVAESLELLREVSQPIAEAYADALRLKSGIIPEDQLEDWLTRVWSLRDFDLGLPDFHPAA